jgi:hypothetical protein
MPGAFGPLHVGPEPIELAGRVRQVYPLRLRDLATLEAWAIRASGAGRADAARSLAAASSIGDRDARRRVLAECYRGHERSGVAFGSPEVQLMLGTLPGQGMQLWCALRGERSRTLTISRATRLAARLADDEWIAVAAVAWCADPLDEAARAIDAEIGAEWPEPEARPDQLAATLWSVVRATRWTLPQIADLTLDQWDFARSHGKPEHAVAEPQDPPPGWGWKQFDRRVLSRRRAFWREQDASGSAPAISVGHRNGTPTGDGRGA